VTVVEGDPMVERDLTPGSFSCMLSFFSLLLFCFYSPSLNFSLNYGYHGLLCHQGCHARDHGGWQEV